MTHHVYLIEFSERKNKNILPYFYIGSKSNSTFNGKIILDKKNKPYFGSIASKQYSQLYKELLKQSSPLVSILGTFDDYDECLHFEKEIQIQNDIVADPRFFNKSIATISIYANPKYGSYRHIITQKCVKLPKDHEKVISGEYVNINKGMRTFNNGLEETQFFIGDNISSEWKLGRLEKNILRGENHPLYGKTPDEKLVERQIKTRTENYKNNPEKYQEMIKNSRIRCFNTFKGVPKSDEFKNQMSHIMKGTKTVTNIITRESKRISIEEEYDTSIWVNPATLIAPPGLGTIWITNGDMNKKIKNDDIIPDGWYKGRIMPKSKHETVWITNGVMNKKILKNHQIPDGWYSGMKRR